MMQFKTFAAALLTGAAVVAAPAGVVAVSTAAVAPTPAVVAAANTDGSEVRVGSLPEQQDQLTVGDRRENAQIQRSGIAGRP